MSEKIWIDLINPSDVLFFNSIISNLTQYEYSFSLRNRAETVNLASSFNIYGKNIGNDYPDKIKKSLNMIYRTLQLQFHVDNFDYALSFENGMSVTVSRFRKKKSISFCDNDLKFFQKKSFFQDLEMKIKSFADYIIIPEACYYAFYQHFKSDKIITYPGYKEDVYIADFTPDQKFLNKIPFEDYIVLRPEALGSFYIKEDKSIVPELIKALTDKNINIVYLPREYRDTDYAKGFDVFIPKKVLNGLDLCYNANAVLTGSGTLAREAACMGITAVSFFPSTELLSVDKKLIQEKKILHSRNIEKITDYVISKNNIIRNLDFERCKKVRDFVVNKTNECLKNKIE